MVGGVERREGRAGSLCWLALACFGLLWFSFECMKKKSGTAGTGVRDFAFLCFAQLYFLASYVRSPSLVCLLLDDTSSSPRGKKALQTYINHNHIIARPDLKLHHTSSFFLSFF